MARGRTHQTSPNGRPMSNRTQQPSQQPTPVDQDAAATAPELIARAADDYAHALAQRDAQSTRDDITGGQH
jgi:hypothetical protein